MRKAGFILAVVLAATGCSNDASIIDPQIRNIESHILRTFGEEVDAYVAEGIYRVVTENIREEGQRGLPLEKGEHILIWFEEYRFDSKPEQKPFFTNIEEVAVTLGVDVQGWSFEELDVKLGSGTILAAVEKALIGCLRGDRVEIFITSNHAYGKSDFGNVPKNCALMFKITVNG